MRYGINQDLLTFWLEHARPGRVGLIHLDFAPARIVNWGQKRLTRDGKPSRWVHAFMFIESRDSVPWIAESDARIPLPGFRKKVDGPQINSVKKWSGFVVDEAAVLESHLTEEQYRASRACVDELHRGNHIYSLVALVGTWVAIRKHDLRHHSILHRAKGMQCSQFVRQCIAAARRDFLDEDVSMENTAPEMVFQRLDLVAEWKK
jgi:hypothetical protein